MIATSMSYPRRIKAVAAPGGASSGMTFSPGKKQHSPLRGHRVRDPALDRAHDVAAAISVEEHESARRMAGGLGDAVREPALRKAAN
jgi:hypothetical protein